MISQLNGFFFPTNKLVAGCCSSARLSLPSDGALVHGVPLIYQGGFSLELRLGQGAD